MKGNGLDAAEARPPLTPEPRVLSSVTVAGATDRHGHTALYRLKYRASQKRYLDLILLKVPTGLALPPLEKSPVSVCRVLTDHPYALMHE